jgi:hypothetical protein
MTDTVYWARLGDLNPIIQTLPQSQNSVMILERLPVAWLDDTMLQQGLRFELLDLAEDFNGWERGRIFNDLGELRWEKDSNHFQVVYVGAEISFSGFNRDDILNSAQPKPQSYYLWGKRLEPEQLIDIGQPEDEELFIELIVPRLLRYPVTGTGKRVMLHTVEYFEPATGKLLHYRFKGVETV